jgi:cell division protein FtsQ
MTSVRVDRARVPAVGPPRVPHGSHGLGRPPRRHRWRALLVLVLGLALLAGGGWVVGMSSLLAARVVRVTGVQTLTTAEVREAAQVPLGTPLARQDLDGIAHRVSRLALVSSVTVSRHWPRTISVQVTERTPVLAVRQPEGFVLVDTGGVRFRTVPAVPAGVVLANVDLTNVSLLKQVGLVASALPDKLKRRVSQLQALSPDGIELVLHDGDVVRWGDADDSSLKSQVLTALLKQPARTYDVSAPHSPALR